MPKNFVGSEGQACIRQQRMSAAAGVLGQYSAAAGAVEFLFTIESVQRNNENLQVTMDASSRIVRQNGELCRRSPFGHGDKRPPVTSRRLPQWPADRTLFGRKCCGAHEIHPAMTYRNCPGSLASCPALPASRRNRFSLKIGTGPGHPRSTARETWSPRSLVPLNVSCWCRRKRRQPVERFRRQSSRRPFRPQSGRWTPQRCPPPSIRRWLCHPPECHLTAGGVAGDC